MDTFGERLSGERKRLGLSQTEFAKLGGVKRLAQGRYESGERRPDADYLMKISAGGVDLLFVLTGARSGWKGAAVDGELLRFVVNSITVESARRGKDAQEIVGGDIGGLAALVYNRAAARGALTADFIEQATIVSAETSLVLDVLGAVREGRSSVAATGDQEIDHLIQECTRLNVLDVERFAEAMGHPNDLGPASIWGSTEHAKLIGALLHERLLTPDKGRLEVVDRARCLDYLRRTKAEILAGLAADGISIPASIGAQPRARRSRHRGGET